MSLNTKEKWLNRRSFYLKALSMAHVSVCVCVEMREKAIRVTTDLFITSFQFIRHFRSHNIHSAYWQTIYAFSWMNRWDLLLYFCKKREEEKKWVWTILISGKYKFLAFVVQSITLWMFFGNFLRFCIWHTHTCARTNDWPADSLKFISNEKLWNIQDFGNCSYVFIIMKSCGSATPHSVMLFSKFYIIWMMYIDWVP